MASSIVKEFRAFAVKGNVIDLAVGVIIGGAFGKIVDSLVNDIVMPLISTLLGAELISLIYLSFWEQFQTVFQEPLMPSKKQASQFLPMATSSPSPSTSSSWHL